MITFEDVELRPELISKVQVMTETVDKVPLEFIFKMKSKIDGREGKKLEYMEFQDMEENMSKAEALAEELQETISAVNSFLFQCLQNKTVKKTDIKALLKELDKVEKLEVSEATESDVYWIKREVEKYHD